MDNPIDLYAKIQPLIQKEAEKIATDVYNKLGTKYNVAEVPTHLHNGIDSVVISESTITPSNKMIAGIVFSATSTDTSIGINMTNPRRICFYGFAANNADGTPATKRAILNGEVQFGRCYNVNGNLTSGVSTVTTQPSGIPFVQVSNGMYVDSTDLTKNRVSTSGGFLARATDDSGSAVVAMTLDTYTSNSITLTCTLGTNWKLQGNIIIS